MRASKGVCISGSSEKGMKHGNSRLSSAYGGGLVPIDRDGRRFFVRLFSYCQATGGIAVHHGALRFFVLGACGACAFHARNYGGRGAAAHLYDGSRFSRRDNIFLHAEPPQHLFVQQARGFDYSACKACNVPACTDIPRFEKNQGNDEKHLPILEKMVYNEAEY